MGNYTKASIALKGRRRKRHNDLNSQEEKMAATHKSNRHTKVGRDLQGLFLTCAFNVAVIGAQPVKKLAYQIAPAFQKEVI